MPSNHQDFTDGVIHVKTPDTDFEDEDDEADNHNHEQHHHHPTSATSTETSYYGDEEIEEYSHGEAEVVDHIVMDDADFDQFRIDNVEVIPEVTLNDDDDDNNNNNFLKVPSAYHPHVKNSNLKSNNNHNANTTTMTTTTTTTTATRTSSSRQHQTQQQQKEQDPIQPIQQEQNQSDTSSPNTTEEDQERMRKLKNMMLADLSVNNVPLTEFSVPSTIVLPSEQLKIRDYAIGTKVKRRDRMINESFRKRKLDRLRRHPSELSDYIPSPVSTLPPSKSVEQLDQIEKASTFKCFDALKKKPWAQKLSNFLYSGPFWNKPKKLQKATTLKDVRQEDIHDVEATIIDLGYALSIYGTPAHRLEYHLALISSYYAINCTSYCTPTGIWITFGNYVDDPNAKTHFVKIRGSSLNLSKLCLLDDVAEKIANGTLSIKGARKAIKEIIEMQPIYSHFMFIIFSCFVQAGMISVFFAANYGEILASFIAGLFVGILSVGASKFESYAQVNTVICALAAGMVGIVFRMLMASLVPISVFVVSLSGVISLIPGLTFTLAISELSTRNLLSGSTRLISAFVTTIQIAFGVLVSDRASHFLPTIFAVPEVIVRHSHSVFTLAAIIPVVVIATVIALKAPKYPIAIVFILLDAYAGFFCTYYGTIYFGPEVGTMLGSFVVGFISNIFGYVSRHPGIVVSACGIIFCLPGAMGRSSADILNNSDPTQFVFVVVIVAISLTVGLMLSDAFVLKRKKLNL